MSKAPRFVLPYRPRKRSGLVFTSPSLSVQDAKDECDVNKILERFAKTGVDAFASRQGLARYGDFSQVPASYQEALTMVDAADKAFMSLPATVREKFGNDALNFVNFASDPNNLPAMVELGLATKKAVASPKVEPQVEKQPEVEAKPKA